MQAYARDAYLETQIITATPQRLRLMLIEGAMRTARAAQDAWIAGRSEEGKAAAGHCRDIITELIAGISPEKSPVVENTLGIYMFLLTTLVEAQFAQDAQRLSDILRVLEEERQTWQAVCAQMPERTAAAPAAQAIEELAPQRVTDAWSPGYSPATPHGRSSASGKLSLEA
ncbi:MAG: flagellar protein FliS [Planctomycetia bacterium]|jgi:flagellar protein FliS|nr:flagellar protein FliS [Planctomycetia bacterium]